jgi:hypothetical protein
VAVCVGCVQLYCSTLTARKRGSRPVVDGFESCEEQYARLPHLAFDALLLDLVGMFAVQQGTAKVVLALAVLEISVVKGEGGG